MSATGLRLWAPWLLVCASLWAPGTALPQNSVARMVDSLETVLARDNQAPSQRLETLILHGNTLKRLGNTLHFAKAVKSYEAAMVLAEQLGLPRRAAEAQLQLGFLFEMTDSHQPEAEFNCTQARKRFSELNDSSGVARACYCLAAVADKAKRYEEAMGLARQAIAYAQGNPEQPRYMLILGRILDNQRRGREAWAVYQQALQNQNLDADTRTDLFYEIMWHGNRTDNPQLSLEFAQKWKNSIDTTNMVFMTQYHDIMAKGLYRLGDYQQAGYHQTMRFETYKVLTLNDQQQQLADARAHFQATLAEQEAALLLQRLESRNIVVLSVILGALLLAAVAVALWIINRRNRLLFTQQQRLADSENALLEQRLALGELERERVVRENERLAVEQALAEARQRQLELDLQLKEQDAEIKSQRLKAELHAAAERLLERRSVMAELSEKLEDVLEDGSRQRNEK